MNFSIGYPTRSEAHRGKSVAIYLQPTTVRAVGGKRAKVFTLMSFGMGENRAIVLAIFVYSEKKRVATFLPAPTVQSRANVIAGRTANYLDAEEPRSLACSLKRKRIPRVLRAD